MFIHSQNTLILKGEGLKPILKSVTLGGALHTVNVISDYSLEGWQNWLPALLMHCPRGSEAEFRPALSCAGGCGSPVLYFQ